MRIIQTIYNKTHKLVAPFFLISLIFLKLPPFYIFPPIQSSFLTSQALSSGLIFANFLIISLGLYLGKIKKPGKSTQTLLLIYLVFLFFNSVSIINAIDPMAFFQRYKNIWFAGLFLFSISFMDLKNLNLILKIFLVTAVINFIYQILMFMYPNQFINLARSVIYNPQLELVNINLARSRLFLETYDEITIPFLFLLFLKFKKTWPRVFIFFLFLAIAIPSFLSNFRTRIVMLIFAFIASFLLLTGKKVVTKIYFSIALIVLAVISAQILNSYFGFSFIDRFLLKDQHQDISTIQFRLNNLYLSADLGRAYPLTGIGIGNYDYYSKHDQAISLSLNSLSKKESEIASQDPHDIFAEIFAETGVLSFGFFLIILLIFVLGDLEFLIKGSNSTKTALVIAFWSLFVYSIFNPGNTLTFNALYWSLRGLITKDESLT
jgi:hypothetical protein